MDHHSTAEQARKLLKQGDITTAQALLQQNLHEEACQCLLREYYLGEQNLQDAMPLVHKMAGKNSVEGLVSQSIVAFSEQNLNLAIIKAEQALNEDENSATAYNHLGRALQNSGQSGRAIKAFKSAVRTQPEYAEAWHNLAHTRRALGVLDDAVDMYKKAISCHASYQSAWFNLAISLSVQEQHAAALQSFEELLKINDQHVLAWVNSGLAHHVLGHLDQAINCYDKAMDLQPDLSLVYCYKGVLLNELQESEQATRCLKHAIKLDPHEVDAWCELTDVYEKLNDLSQANEANQQALAIDPNNPTALIDAARIQKRHKKYQQALSTLDSVHEGGLPMRKATEYWFERADVLDKLGEFDLAYDNYTRANTLATKSPRHQQIDPKAFDHRLNQIKHGLARHTHTKTGGWLPESLGKWMGKTKPAYNWAEGANLCFLVGFPRSGTTLVDTILNTSPDVVSIEEKPTVETVMDTIKVSQQSFWDENFNKTADWQQLRQTYWDTLNQFVEVDKKQIIVDKLPMRFLETEFIRALFPQAKFLFMVRHPSDVILSNFMQNYAPNKTFIHFNSLEHTVSMYTHCMDVWYAVRQNLGNRLKEIKYEDLVSQPEKTTQDLCRFLNVSYGDEMLDTEKRLNTRERIKTNSYAQVAMDIHKNSVHRWEDYTQYFEKYQEILSKHTQQLGYKM